VTLNLKSVEDVGQVALELHINDGTDNLSDGADGGLLAEPALEEKVRVGATAATGARDREGLSIPRLRMATTARRKPLRPTRGREQP